MRHIRHASSSTTKPVILDVTLVNETDEPVSFSYKKPSDILAMYVTREHPRGDREFLPPRPGVTWLRPSQGVAEKQVTLEPHGEHHLRLAVMDYFELLKTRDDEDYEATSVWLSVSLPGFHQIPKLAGGGSGINPR